MDPEFAVPEDAVEARAMRPMFVASADDGERGSAAEAEAYRTEDGRTFEHDWLTERMMESYN